ncbi:MAG: hypothetical protein LBM66_07310, partial [Bifidobacteriaceae bacterium]|nr:hypothetical protein [Bifidobacteriaceae bacterium]
PSKPAGVARRLIDSSLARRHGWNPGTSLKDGLARTVAAYRRRGLPLAPGETNRDDNQGDTRQP